MTDDYESTDEGQVSIASLCDIDAVLSNVELGVIYGRAILHSLGEHAPDERFKVIDIFWGGPSAYTIAEVSDGKIRRGFSIPYLGWDAPVDVFKDLARVNTNVGDELPRARVQVYDPFFLEACGAMLEEMDDRLSEFMQPCKVVQMYSAAKVMKPDRYAKKGQLPAMNVGLGLW